jgi:hypothetical protein
MSEAEEIARFCADLAELRRLLRGPASAERRAILEQAVRAARRGEPVGPFLARLRPAPPPPTQEWPEPEYQGSFDGPPRGTTPTALFDAATPPVTGVYVCPGDTCVRVAERRAGSPVPRCDIHEQALRFVADPG